MNSLRLPPTLFLLFLLLLTSRERERVEESLQKPRHKLLMIDGVRVLGEG